MTTHPLDHTAVQCGNRPGLALLAELHHAAFSSQGERSWTPSEFADILAIPGTSAKLYRSNGKPIGFVIVRTVLDEAELISIAVDPAFQGQGFAKKMMDDITRQLQALKVSQLFLEVREDNNKALKLYSAINFKKISERKDYYKTLSGQKFNAHVFLLDMS